MRRPTNATHVNGVWIPNPPHKNLSIVPIESVAAHIATTTRTKKLRAKNSMTVDCSKCGTGNAFSRLTCHICGFTLVMRKLPFEPIDADKERAQPVVDAKSAPPATKKKKEKPAPPGTTEEVLQTNTVVDALIEHLEDLTAKPEEKKGCEKDKKKHKMRKWPENLSELLPYQEIVSPLKDIIRQGYRLWRKDDVKTFDYIGYNIGKQELVAQPPPNVRLSEKFLEREKKEGHHLIDVVLNIMFLMGVEQGRRAERRDIKPVEMLLQTLEIYREKNKNQRIRIDELEVLLELTENFPQLPIEEFQYRLKEGLAIRRAKRIAELKSELTLDVSRSSFQFKTPPRIKFKELENLARSITKETCTEEQWKHILEERGWTYKEWTDRCKKKNINIAFT